MVLPIICSGLKRSASTWSYNVCRELLVRSLDPSKAVLIASYATNTDAALQRLARRKPDGRRLVALLKAHEVGPWTLAGIRQRKIRNVYTVRDPRDALASLIRFWPPTDDEPFGTYVRNFQKWLIQGEAFIEERASLVIRYEDMLEDPRKHVRAIARYIGLRADERRIAAVDEATSHENLQAAVARIEGAAEDPEAAFDPKLQLHRRHLDSGEIGRWRHELNDEERRKAVVAFLPWLVSLGYEEQGVQDILDRLA